MKTKKIMGLVLVACVVSALVMVEASDKNEAAEKDTSAASQKKWEVQRSGSMPHDREGQTVLFSDVPAEKGELKSPVRSPIAGRPVRGPVDPQQRYQQMLSKRAEIHKQGIDELEEIKKIAQEEGAARTVEAIQKMIDKKNAEYKKSIQGFTRMQRERADQIRQRTGKPVLNVEKAKEAASQKEPVK